MRNSKQEIRPGSYVFIRKEYFSKENPKHKLAPIADGPYKVKSGNEKTVVIEIGQHYEGVSRDRVVKAPPPLQITNVQNNEEGKGKASETKYTSNGYFEETEEEITSL